MRARHRKQAARPVVWLGPTEPDSIAVSIYVIVRDAARRHPRAAAQLQASVRLCFAGERYPAVRIDFRGGEIEVADDQSARAACDLELRGRLGDVAALVAAPLAGGLPNPTTSGGLQALFRLADGRVEVRGSLTLARDVLRLLAVDPERAPARRMRVRTARGPQRRRGDIATTRFTTRRRDDG